MKWVGIHGDSPEEVQVQVDGDELHIHRPHQGGWSQRRFQQRAENQWEANAQVRFVPSRGGPDDRLGAVLR